MPVHEPSHDLFLDWTELYAVRGVQLHNYVGRWRITWTENWDQDYGDYAEAGYFEFTEDGMGSFVIGDLSGVLDVRVSPRIPLMEFSWKGTSEGEEYCGRGWFEFETADKGLGHLFIHGGDESTLIIEREIEP